MAFDDEVDGVEGALDGFGDPVDDVDPFGEPMAPAEPEAPLNKVVVQDVAIEDIEPNPWNPNEQDDVAFNRLTEELQTVGMIDPIQVVPMASGKYRILGGEHRYQAAKLLGWATIPCVILSEERWQDEDLQKLVTVRLNMLKGKLNPEKMATLYTEMAGKYGDQALQNLFAFTDTDAWEKLVKSITKGLKASLPKEIAEKFEEAAKEVKTVDDLSNILNHLFNKYGDTLKYSFMVFTFGGKDHIYVAMDKSTKSNMDKVLTYCKEEGIDLNKVIGPLSAVWLDETKKRGVSADPTETEEPEQNDYT
jgi:ParB/RepB/Spo0J family partition protein